MMCVQTCGGGLVAVEIISPEPEAAFCSIMENGISIYSVSKTDPLTAAFLIRSRELPALQMLTERRGEGLRIIGRKGIFWQIRALSKRPVLIFGALLIIFMTVFIPTRILFLRVEGNIRVPSGRILDAAAECGMGFGTSRKALRSESVKNKMLTMLPELEWIGVNTSGCTACISVSERPLRLQEDQTEPSCIVASRDGIVCGISVTKGTGHCTVGDAVLEGQLLISGNTDCGNVLLSGRAEGEVYAYTSRTVAAVSPAVRHYRQSPGRKSIRYSICFGKKRINLWKGSGICPVTCDRMYREYWLTLPGGFTLPVCIIREQCVPYQLISGSAGDISGEMVSIIENHVASQISGGRILHQKFISDAGKDMLEITGSFGCIEMIGREQCDRTGEIYG